MPTSLYWTEDLLDLDFAAAICPDAAAFYSCIHCGSCTATCPTATHMRQSPQRMWRLLRLGMYQEVLDDGAFWLCTSCDACTVHCPRRIPLLETIIGLKSHTVQRLGRAPEDVALLRRTIETTRNISGDDNSCRLRWSENLPDPPTPVALSDADVVLFIGCVGSFYPRAFSVPQALARLLRHAGVSYGVLGGDELCCGYPLYNAGFVDDVDALATHHVRLVRKAGVSTLITPCPSCYYTWRKLYPRYVQLPAGLRILHSTQALAELLDAGRLKPRPSERVVTYHDPCDLGRKGDEFDAPRAVIQSIAGLELREMANIRVNALCCGGGGDVKIYSQDTTMAVATRRLRQANDVGAEVILSGCQQCKRALTGAVQLARRPTRVADIIELLWDLVREDRS